MNENFDAFDKYAMNYDMNEKMIAFKYNHSYRVVHQAEEICRSLEMDTYERDVASLIALLHDIARFRQWTEYKTFSDKDSFDHGDVGVQILFDENEIKNYTVNKEDYDVIKKAIINHNKVEIDKSLNERELLHSKIIRDADKIDILYSFSTDKLIEIRCYGESFLFCTTIFCPRIGNRKIKPTKKANGNSFMISIMLQSFWIDGTIMHNKGKKNSVRNKIEQKPKGLIFVS